MGGLTSGFGKLIIVPQSGMSISKLNPTRPCVKEDHARPIVSGLHAVYDEKGASITRRRRQALNRSQIVRNVYRAFAAGDRTLIEQTFADDFTFSSPLDVGLDRVG